MRRVLSFCAVILTLAPFLSANAASSDADADDIVILSVKPRSPYVKPIAVRVSADGHEAAVKARPATSTQRIASGTDASTRR